MKKTMKVERMGWDEFRRTKLLWFINRLLHVFGWAIVVGIDENDQVTEVYPARVTYRGFDEKIEAEGFLGLTAYLQENACKLLEEVKKDG